MPIKIEPNAKHRIEKSEVKLDKAVPKHGAGSRQAQTARRELNLEREHCWTQYHAWWDAHTRQWHNEHDWDRDRDRDRDRCDLSRQWVARLGGNGGPWRFAARA